LRTAELVGKRLEARAKYIENLTNWPGAERKTQGAGASPGGGWPFDVTEPERFARCLNEGFAEVLALSGSDSGTNPPIRTV